MADGDAAESHEAREGRAGRLTTHSSVVCAGSASGEDATAESCEFQHRLVESAGDAAAAAGPSTAAATLQLQASDAPTLSSEDITDRATSTAATAEPGHLLPTLEDDLLSQALAMGAEQFAATSLCLAARVARSPRGFALKQAKQRLVELGWQAEQLPTGLGGLGTLAQLRAACVLEGLTVSAPPGDARFCRLLRAFGASATHSGTADFCCTTEHSTLSRAAAHGDVASSVSPPLIRAAALEVFVFSPFVSKSQSFKSGQELTEEQIAEVLEGYDGYECGFRSTICLVGTVSFMASKSTAQNSCGSRAQCYRCRRSRVATRRSVRRGLLARSYSTYAPKRAHRRLRPRMVSL